MLLKHFKMICHQPEVHWLPQNAYFKASWLKTSGPKLAEVKPNTT